MPVLRKVAVVMITMNQQDAIPRVVLDIRGVLPLADIIVVDSSTDCTPQIARDLGCMVIRQIPPQCYGLAMDRALRAAAVQAEVVITMDCNGAYPADSLLDLLNEIQAGADLVDGNRVWRRPPAMPLANFLANRAFGWLARVLCGAINQDLHSGMRAYRKSMLDQLLWDPDGPALPVELVLLPQRLGFKVVQVPINYKERLGTTPHRWASSWWTLKRIWNIAGVNHTNRAAFLMEEGQ